MSCSPFDLRDYVLKELSDPERKQVDLHVRGCGPCREEVERLRLTEAALFSLRDEEIPQRIAFVSDKVFEPSPWRRGWDALWGSSARLGFASAAMLSVALIVFSLARTAGSPAAPLTARVGNVSISEAEIQQRIQTAVDQAVAASQKKLEQRVAEIEKVSQADKARVSLAASAIDFLQRANMLQQRSAYDTQRSSGDLR